MISNYEVSYWAVTKMKKLCLYIFFIIIKFHAFVVIGGLHRSPKIKKKVIEEFILYV